MTLSQSSDDLIGKLSLRTLRAMHTQPKMVLLHDLPPFVSEGRTQCTLFPDNKFPVPFHTDVVIRDRAAEFREEVEHILNEITLDEWTHPALDKIEDALLKGEE